MRNDMELLQLRFDEEMSDTWDDLTEKEKTIARLESERHEVNQFHANEVAMMQERIDELMLASKLSVGQGNVRGTRMQSDKVLVVARYQENTDWLQVFLGQYMQVIISRDLPAATYNLSPNKGNEAASFLYYIVEFYDELPDNLAFIHAHRHAYHQTTDIIHVLQNLRWGENPYVSMNSDIIMSMGHNDTEWLTIVQVWDDLFRDELGDLPEDLLGPCCAQFAITREAILKHPKAFYQKILNWLLTTPMETYWSGRVLEHTWHYIFGMPAVMPASMVDRCKYLMHC
eukprot:TRINITY_DN12394_c0_g1_i1.p1 TRINITY_DN12394_c0_g1~~TRINITY_DN12394_c0_g1_i1.p1  ORF type:complete len:336 (+),score=31.56 TRINITY_DN12394_c0_g1_i1:151-1008(+)